MFVLSLEVVGPDDEWNGAVKVFLRDQSHKTHKACKITENQLVTIIWLGLVTQEIIARNKLYQDILFYF